MYAITLNKKNRTIKVRHTNKRITLKHTGNRGPQGTQGIQGEQGIEGPQGPTGVSTFVRVHHGSDPNVARPSALYVEWVGTVAPLNATVEDTWIDIN
jgi:hypothetical protein